MPRNATLQDRRSDSLKLDAEFQALIAPLMADERSQLESNLVAEGCRDALVVWNGILLDGHNRFEICTRLGIRYKSSASSALYWRSKRKLPTGRASRPASARRVSHGGVVSQGHLWRSRRWGQDPTTYRSLDLVSRVQGYE